MARFSLIVSLFICFSALANEDVNFYIFSDELPAKGVEISLSSGQTLKTDRSGNAEFSLGAGSYIATLKKGGKSFQSIPFEVLKGENTTINYTLLAETSEVLNSDSSAENSTVELKESSLNSGTLIVSTVSRKGNLPVSNVQVLVHGTGQKFKTDKDGKLTISLPKGKYGISFIHKDYSTTTFKDLQFEVGKTYREKVLLSPSGMELEEFVVLSPTLKSSVSALLEIRRGHSSVADLIGGEQISKSGDSDAGSSLKRVTGLSLVDDKYVYVRGLGERYSSTLLNGAMLPSPDPSRRVVPLDLFPASVIENMVVQKGYSASMPGEFGGGSIQIKTKSLPEKRYTKFSISQNFESTAGVKTYKGANNPSGMASGDFDMPNTAKELIDAGINLSALSGDERKALAKDFNKSYETYEATSGRNIPNVSLAHGNRFRFGRLKVGYNFSTLYSNKWSLDSVKKTSFNQSGSELTVDSETDQEKSKNKIKLGGLAGLGAKFKSHSIEYNGAILRNTESYVYESSGVNSEDEDVLKTELGWKERSIQLHQFSGKSTFNGLNKLTLDWAHSYSKAFLDEPGNKMYTYVLGDSGYQLETENGSSTNMVSWKKMPDVMRNSLATLSLPIGKTTTTVGVNTMNRDRDYNSTTFYYQFDTATAFRQSNGADKAFSSDDAEIYQQANNTDNYKANQSIDSYFSSFNYNGAYLNVELGMRFEDSRQEVNSFKLFGAGETQTLLQTKDYLPAVSMTYKVLPTVQIRANYSETVSRPDLREISNTVWTDVEEGARYKGNPNLQAAQIKNAGIRGEWYFGRGEIASIGYFRKDFTNPIEEIYGSLNDDGEIVGTTEQQYTFLNIDNAVSQGIEVEFRKKLPLGFTFGGNYSWIKSAVSISPENSGQLTSLDRPLQGQSPYLMNFQLDYEHKNSKSIASLLYNSIGRRIVGVGADGRPDEYQEKFSSLDFVASKSFLKSWKVKFKAKNLLDPAVERTQGEKVTQLSRRGREFSLGLSAVF